MKARAPLQWLLCSAMLGAALTLLYFVHEDLPRAVRAPTSLLLAPVAIVDGLCYALGVPGIYGRPMAVLVVNLVFGVATCSAVLGVKSRWGRRRARKRPHAGGSPGDR